MAKKKSFDEVWDFVSRNLPKGWQIKVVVDGSGGGYDVVLIDPDGDEPKFASDQQTLLDTVEDAVEAAVRYSRLPEWNRPVV